jgi:hypothetical protein
VANYPGSAVLSAILKLVELLVYQSMNGDLKNLISVEQHGFVAD